MNNKYLLLKNYKEKEIIVNSIESIADKLNLRKEKENLYSSLADLDLYLDVNDEDFHFLGIRVMNSEEFKRDKVIVDEEEYFIALSIDHESFEERFIHMFLKEFLPFYSEMIIADESTTQFYTIEDLQNNNIPWLQRSF
ncbi:hypothetical protein ACFO3O_14605 [Dokdonia ponticola]|uniref:IPExxxVDY family protein n=1 Tax=Dokdonia ponticola TaxID=2041041 RepID=A0ABV9HYW4_9FLAO